MTSAEEQAGPAGDRAPKEPVRADQNRGRRPIAETQSADAAIADEQADVATEHDSLTVGDDPLDERSESDASD